MASVTSTLLMTPQFRWAAQPQCLITGCGLYQPNEDRIVHGDLHLVGRCYVFNGVYHKDGPYWFTLSQDELAGKRYISVDSNLVLEKRAMFVFDIEAGELSEAAKDYLLHATPFKKS
jgi:hypothetical protein